MNLVLVMLLAMCLLEIKILFNVDETLVYVIQLWRFLTIFPDLSNIRDHVAHLSDCC